MIVAAAATKIILICHSQIHFEYSKINDTRADIFFSIALAVFIVWILCRSDFTTHKVICQCCIYDKCTMNTTCIGNPIEVSLLVLEVELVNCVASMQYQQKKKDLQKSTDCKCIIKKKYHHKQKENCLPLNEKLTPTEETPQPTAVPSSVKCRKASFNWMRSKDTAHKETDNLGHRYRTQSLPFFLLLVG